MNKQFYEELLAKFQKANKVRKLYLANKAGYSNIDDYKKALEVSIVGMPPVESPIEEATSSDEETLDMVIAFDTTGSMSSYIAAVKSHVKELIPNLFKNSPKLQIKIVAFGDYCDMKSSTVFGKAYQESNLTNNENELINFVNNAQNTAGGDGDEFYELVIKKIVEETPWRTNSKKAVLLIGDAEPHEVGYSHGLIVHKAQIDWRDEANKAAALGIQFDTLKIIPRTVWYEELSKITGGISLDFKSASKTSNIVEGLAYARSSKKAYAKSYSTVMESGDSELIGAYKTMSTLL